MSEKKLTGVYFYNPDGTSKTIDFSEVASYVSKNPDVTVIWNHQDVPLSDSGKMANKISEKNLRRIIIAGDMPGMVKSYFTKAMVEAGNKPEDVFLASFREYGAIRMIDTERAKAIMAAAIQGISFETAAVTEEISLNPDTLVIGGGIAGIQASLEIADAGQQVYLIEKSGTIGGHMAMFPYT
jgi:heterodisulfide reductase subunit A